MLTTSLWVRQVSDMFFDCSDFNFMRYFKTRFIRIVLRCGTITGLRGHHQISPMSKVSTWQPGMFGFQILRFTTSKLSSRRWQILLGNNVCSPYTAWNTIYFRVSRGKYSGLDQFQTRVVVNNDGKVQWMGPSVMRTSCQVDIKMFPFDSQVRPSRCWQSVDKVVVIKLS